MMDLDEYCRLAAKVMRSSERMVQRNVEIWKQTPENDGKYYDPDWDVHISQKEADLLISNLSKAADLLDLLGGAHDA